MFESLKKLFARQASPPTEPEVQPVIIHAPASHAPAPARTAPPPRPALGAALSPVPLRTGELVHLPLNDILTRLPAPVAPLLVGEPGGTFSIPLRTAVEQLATGSVKVPFGNLRQSSPPGTFVNDPSQDNTMIDLPLQQVLAAIGPGAFSRRSQQKTVAVPEDVTGVFGPKGAPLPRIVPKPPEPAPPSAPPVAPGVAPAIPSIPIAPKPAAATAPAPPPVPAPVRIAPIAPSTKPALRETPVKLPTAPLPFSSVKAPSPLPFASRPAPAAPPAPAAEPAKPAGTIVDESALVTTLGAISKTWPDAVRQEIDQLHLGGATVSIPMSRLEAGMKTGRVIFNWSDLLGWLGTPVTAPTAHGETVLSLPLEVIAPLFVEKRRAAAPQKKVVLGENIPDLFTGLGKRSVTAPGVAPASASAPDPSSAPPVAPPPAVVPTAAATVAAAAEFAPALKKETPAEPAVPSSQRAVSPLDIARHLAALPGVAGSLLATADGLHVAGEVPAPLQAETLAAFLPQIHGRVSSYSEEIKLGPLFAITLTAGAAPCTIFKSGTLYMAVVGKPGQNLPDPEFLEMAAQMSQSNP